MKDFFQEYQERITSKFNRLTKKELEKMAEELYNAAREFEKENNRDAAEESWYKYHEVFEEIKRR